VTSIVANRTATSDFYSLITSRRSVRRYQPTQLEPELIERLLNAAAWAPSAHNRQPFTRQEDKEKLGSEMGARLRADRTADNDPAQAIEADVRRSYTRITTAPCVIVVCLTLEDMDVYPDERRSAAEHLMAVQGVALSIQNLLLAAAAEGLGACWMCAPLFCQDTVKNALDLPSSWQAQGLITLGYPASRGKEPVRKSLDGLVAWRTQ
jgi:F420 biosynthesis protein FbiB-like protein